VVAEVRVVMRIVPADHGRQRLPTRVGPFARLDLGGVERWMVYPVVLWLVGFGSYVAASPPTDALPSSLPGAAGDTSRQYVSSR
jgi:hypothetical protein